MTELELYKYINDNNIEWHCEDNNGTPDVLIFPYVFQVEGFYKLLKGSIDEGIECRLMDGYFAFWMNDICNSHDIEFIKCLSCGRGLKYLFTSLKYTTKN